MRWLRWTVQAILLFAIAVFLGGQMGLLAGKRPDNLGATNGQLAAVDNKPENSVSSQTTRAANRIDPLAAGPDPARGFEILTRLVADTNGAEIIEQAPNYVYAEFTTPLLGFVDDVEFLLDTNAGQIHVRSASRLGRKDFGTNRKRIEALRARLRESLGTASVPSSSQGDSPMTFQTLPSGLQVADITTGDGEEAAAGQQVTVHYTGWLYENGAAGAKFDSSKDRNQPFRFGLGQGQVIRGWDEGVTGMKVGGTRKLIIPPELGYGARGAGGVIPPNATLLFEVELLGV